MSRLADITPLTYLDYPKKAACIFWYAGCNLRCPYCYNSELVLDSRPDSIGRNWIEFLKERAGFIDAVVLSGGEATLIPDIYALCETIKDLGYLIKLDTNGSNPDVVEKLVESKLLDYVAVDNKMPSTKSWSFSDGVTLFEKFSDSMSILQASEVPYEVRTTVHPSLLSEKDILQMIDECKALGYSGTYYLQLFFNTGKTLGNIKSPDRRYNRSFLDSNSSLPIGYRNFPELTLN